MQATPPSQPSAAPNALPAGARSAPTATEMYEAARLSRQELRSQLSQLKEERRSLQRDLERSPNAVSQKGIEARIANVDQRIADVDKQIAAADQVVAARAGVPGVVIEPPPLRDNGPPPEVYVLGGLSLLVVVLLPITIGWGRRLWRRGAGMPASALPPEFGERMASMERAVEAVAIEMERIGEGQRWVTQLLSEQGKARAEAAEARRLPGESR